MPWTLHELVYNDMIDFLSMPVATLSKFCGKAKACFISKSQNNNFEGMEKFLTLLISFLFGIMLSCNYHFIQRSKLPFGAG
jgi:hypothetical protein